MKFERKVNYYETDKMGIVHHSNYIRWMEEARIYFLENIGFGYEKLESDGIISPVIGINCEYKDTTTFNDEIAIDVWIKEFKGVRLIIEYRMENVKTGKLVLKGVSEHCFLDNNRKPVRLSKEFPEFNQKLKELANGSV